MLQWLDTVKMTVNIHSAKRKIFGVDIGRTDCPPTVEFNVLLEALIKFS